METALRGLAKWWSTDCFQQALHEGKNVSQAMGYHHLFHVIEFLYAD